MFGIANGDWLVSGTPILHDNERPIQRRCELSLGVLLKSGPIAYMTSVSVIHE